MIYSIHNKFVSTKQFIREQSLGTLIYSFVTCTDGCSNIT